MLPYNIVSFMHLTDASTLFPLPVLQHIYIFANSRSICESKNAFLSPLS